jgi:hypothetical protein
MKSAARAITEPAPASEAPAVIELPPPRRRGVRRKAVDPRIARIELRTTPARKAAIEADAKMSGMTTTRYLLSHLPGASEPVPLVALADPVILTRMLAQIGRLCSNVNQLARDRNTTGQDPHLAELEAIRAEAMDIRAALLQALGL